jgi:hypothetical protein
MRPRSLQPPCCANFVRWPRNGALFAGLQKLHKVRKPVPPEVHFHSDIMRLFLYFITGKLTPRERQAFIKSSEIDLAGVSLWQKLEPKFNTVHLRCSRARLRRATTYRAERVSKRP